MENRFLRKPKSILSKNRLVKIDSKKIENRSRKIDFSLKSKIDFHPYFKVKSVVSTRSFFHNFSRLFIFQLKSKGSHSPVRSYMVSNQRLLEINLKNSELLIPFQVCPSVEVQYLIVFFFHHIFQYNAVRQLF